MYFAIVFTGKNLDVHLTESLSNLSLFLPKFYSVILLFVYECFYYVKLLYYLNPCSYDNKCLNV